MAAALAAAREARLYRRLEALLLVAEGHPVAEAARRCRVDRTSVHRWLAQYAAQRSAGALAERARSGRPRQAHALTPERLAALLARDPREAGYRATNWKAHELSPMDQLWRGLKQHVAANRQAASIDALAAEAANWVLALTPAQARRKAGMNTQRFWLRNLLQHLW